VPLAKALEKESLIAWAMNDEDIPHLNGYPLRLVCAGWPASVSGKWLARIVIRDRVHDGPKMTGTAYRVPCKPVAPGSEVPEEQMCIIESMPVKSLITYPKSGIEHALGKKFALRGHAWAGDLSVNAVHVSIDFGASWHQAKLEKRELASSKARKTREPPCLAALEDRSRVSRIRLLRGLGSRNR
jgi:DMSO/TMAO reductase YedYZ molybdopterin-dependent catalytic subunit